MFKFNTRFYSSLVILSVLLSVFALKVYSEGEQEESPTAKLLGEEEGSPLGDEGCIFTEKELTAKSVEALCEKIKHLNGRIDDLEAGQSATNDSIQAILDAPSEDLNILSNFLMTGTGYTFYRAPNHIANGTFGTVLDPVILWRYGDNMLFEMKLDITLVNHDTNIQLVYGTFDYVVNDWLTFRAGKYSTPLGFVWEKMTTGWINKLPTLPLPYNPRAEALTPPAEVGVDIRGAVPFQRMRFDCHRKIPFVLNYDLWIGNGPDEVAGLLDLGTNYNDNNNNVAIGSRIGFRFEPDREIGFSCEWGQWNNNKYAPPVREKHPLFYKAIVIDLHWRFEKVVDILGEFIYTSYGAIPNKTLGIHSCDITQIGGWLQFSGFLFWYFDCPCSSIWQNFEGVIRYGFVDSGISSFSGEQWSFGLNYHFSNLVILKAAYDLNLGKRIPANVFIIQLAYAY